MIADFDMRDIQDFKVAQMNLRQEIANYKTEFVNLKFFNEQAYIKTKKLEQALKDVEGELKQYRSTTK